MSEVSGYIHFPVYKGEIIKYNGKCYSLNGTVVKADSVCNPTVISGFIDCDDCIEFSSSSSLSSSSMTLFNYEYAPCASSSSSSISSVSSSSSIVVNHHYVPCVSSSSSSSISSSSSNSTVSSSSSESASSASSESSSSQSSDGGGLDAPSGYSCSIGDVHYIYGDPDEIAISTTNASLNVDDNISDNIITWWTHTEGSVEYIVRYGQQEFDYTVGGRSIDYIEVSASDLSVNNIYTLTTPQTGTLRNGVPFVGLESFDLGTAMSISISERLIDPSDCCNILSDPFALFNLDVSPKDQFTNINEYGGALWYIWKKASTLGLGAINNPSSAGFDGIGTFLSGFDGYTARSQFETTPSSVRETFDFNTASAVFDKLTELSTISGSWDADWDPLANTPLDCPADTCGTPNADPTMYMTLSWVDSDVSKNFLGCTWCNGETKEVYASNYLQSGTYTAIGTTVFRNKHYWTQGTWQMQRKALRWYIGTYEVSFDGTAIFRLGGLTDGVAYLRGPANGTGGMGPITTTNINLGLLSIGDAPLTLGTVVLNSPNIMPNTYTDVAGITYSWTQGNGW